MKRVISITLMLIALMLGTQVYAGSTPIRGTGSIAENGCVAFLEIFGLASCTYNESSILGPFPAGSWIGPIYTGGYYAVGTGPASGAGVPGDGKQGPALTGKISIMGSGPGAVIGGTIEVGPTVLAFAGQGQQVGYATWKRLSYTIADKVADSATPNAFGGYTYVIGTQGVPAPLVSLSTLYTFPGEAGGNFFGPPFWTKPGAPGVNDTAGITSVESEIVSGLPNVGTTASARFQQASCTENAVPGACDTDSAILNDPDIDNLLMVIDTNECGRVLTGRAVATREIRLVPFGPPGPNFWSASTWTFETGPDDDGLNNECND